MSFILYLVGGVTTRVNQNRNGGRNPIIRDYGAEAMAVNIDHLSKLNTNYRIALWTGEHLQVTLMSIPPGGDIGLEMHENVDQFIRIEEGCALVKMGKFKNQLDYQKRINKDFAIFIPAHTWHNIMNVGAKPLKIYSIYAPPQHPFGTVHQTKQIAQSKENH